MVQTVGSVPCERFDDLVDQSVKLVRVMSGCQFALGDFALEIAPLRNHGGNMSPAEGEEQGVEDSLRLFAEEIGLSFHTVRTYRWVAARWPKDQRQEGVSFEVHRILASAPDAYELIQHPPVNERTGLSEWSGDAAKRAAGWATATPVTAAEKVEAIRDLAQDEAVAAQAACDLLHRPEVAFKAMRDRQARELVNQAQFDQAELVEEGDEEEDWWDENGAAEEDGIVDPVAIVRGFHRAMEFTDLIGVCQGFVAGASRLVPRLRGREFSESQLALVTRHLEKIRATADWIETAVSTGKVDLDEALAELLRDK
ncbi:DUF6192 family protein [Streptomyces malaysiensis]|uniref:DUF6192 family protein n=1 Tax=Streptomyces malaysiensis subsp. samsunensis TaxID=459658 RepID=A0A9X2MA06_STRMQ|nr:DUF6192 family protein [Streptomyces samsunensis]MCQ8835834.1 DUF6192 family protein [Streptomyces samsunensis]